MVGSLLVRLRANNETPHPYLMYGKLYITYTCDNNSHIIKRIMGDQVNSTNMVVSLLVRLRANNEAPHLYSMYIKLYILNIRIIQLNNSFNLRLVSLN